LAVWAGHVELLSPAEVTRIRHLGGTSAAPAGAVLGRAHRLREQLHRLLFDPTDRDAFAGFAAIAQTANRATVLSADPGGTVRRTLPEPVGLALPLLAVVLAAEGLLTDPVRAAVRACPGGDCGWLFLDVRGRRRWCDMASCGNRAKVGAHAARQQG
jgi:predicted RNA-binding Zn ribbon-like protein